MKRLALLALVAGTVLSGSAQAASFFNPGNLVVLVEGAGVRGGTAKPYSDNQAAPITLYQYKHTGTSSATYQNALVLPQKASGANYAISGEYGSSSEGFLQLTGDGKSLTLAGYGVNAAAFNANPAAYGTALNSPSKPTALAQSGSLTGQAYTPVARVAALVGANGSVDTTTALFNVDNGNNPRSVWSADGSSFYISGQGITGDNTGGVFYALHGDHAATAITGKDTSGKTASQETRFVTGANGQLYVSTDTKQGSGSNRDFVGTLGAFPTSLYNNGAGPTRLPGFGNSGGTGKVTLTAGQTNGINAAGKEINLSPEQFFFADPNTLYVADSGMPKNDSVTNDGAIGSTLGDGGLQKWSLINGSWTLDYTLSAGLNLVRNDQASGVTGLFGLTGQVVDGQVMLFATSYTIGDTDQSYLYGITDLLSAKSKPANEQFVVLDAAPVDSKFRGVSFAPVNPAAAPEPGTYALMILGFGAAGGLFRARRRGSLRTA